MGSNFQGHTAPMLLKPDASEAGGLSPSSVPNSISALHFERSNENRYLSTSDDIIEPMVGVFG